MPMERQWGLSLLTDIAAPRALVSPDNRAEAGARARSIIDVDPGTNRRGPSDADTVPGKRVRTHRTGEER